jgi:lysine 6-dehydrogenase
MRIALLGCGMMARAIAHDCLDDDGLLELRLADHDGDRLIDLAARLDDARVVTRRLDATDPDAVLDWLDGAGVLISASSYRLNLGLARCAVAAGCHFVDLGGNNDVVAAELGLDEEARRAGVVVLPDMGLAPGLVNVLTRRAEELLGGLDEARLRVGGLPREPRGEWRYEIVFSAEGLVNEYREPCRVLRGGRPTTVPALSEIEELEHPVLGALEAFHTSGGASTLPQTYAGRADLVEYKTLRYPGHARLVRALFELGLDDDEPREVDGARLRPRRLLERQLETRLAGTGRDLVVLLADFRGPGGRLHAELLDYADEETGLTAMMRCTGFPVAAAARLLAAGRLERSGALPPERALPAAEFLAVLAERGLELNWRSR